MQFCDIENEAEEFVYFDETNTKDFFVKNFPFPAELNQSRAAVSEGLNVPRSSRVVYNKLFGLNSLIKT